MYKSPVDLPAFAAAFPVSRAPLRYNGNVVDRASYEKVMSTVPALERMMIGRGAAADPALFRLLSGGAPLEAAELRDFLDRLLSAFLNAGLGERFALSRLKELWYYLIWKFPGAQRQAKAINKARTLGDYRAAVQALFASGLYDEGAAFHG